ncbi:MAG: hypothetical protein U5K00_21535 [Melioribacteraceae bacterium]|nr:hypothetical protein [Melioribacteraceae bacterium]
MTKSMEKLKGKLKSSSIITLVLGIISLTWIIIDYFVIQTILEDGKLAKFSLEWILLLTSGLALIAFHFSVFITLFYVFRIIFKIKPGEDKLEKDESGNFQSKELDQ